MIVKNGKKTWHSLFYCASWPPRASHSPRWLRPLYRSDLQDLRSLCDTPAAVPETKPSHVSYLYPLYTPETEDNYLHAFPLRIFFKEGFTFSFQLDEFIEEIMIFKLRGKLRDFWAACWCMTLTCFVIISAVCRFSCVASLM